MSHFNQHLYAPSYSQQGAGIGHIFSNVLRRAVPFIKQGVSYLGKQLFNQSFNTLDDVLGGENFKTSAKKRFRETKDKIKEDARSKIRQILTGRGKIIRKKHMKNIKLVNKKK